MKRLPQVKLRAWEKSDLDLGHKFFNDPEVMNLMESGTVMPMSREEGMSGIESFVNPKDKNTSYNFAVENETGRFIGCCGYSSVNPKNRTCMVQIAIVDKKCWGKGYGTAAMKKLLDFLFLEKNMRKVQLHVFAFNERAVACYEKLGFKAEGRLREQTYRDGRYHDDLVMAIFDRDFRRKPAAD